MSPIDLKVLMEIRDWSLCTRLLLVCHYSKSRHRCPSGVLLQKGCLDEEAAILFEEVLWTASQADSTLENLLPVLIALRVQVRSKDRSSACALSSPKIKADPLAGLFAASHLPAQTTKPIHTHTNNKDESRRPHYIICVGIK